MTSGETDLRRKAKAQAHKAEFDASDLALIELFSDPKGHAPRGTVYNFDAERGEFIQDELHFAIEQALTGKPRKPRRIRLPKD